ncbi:hypothetical protein WDW37_17365 [Bdellovibrionota bacterium FG-1]
MKTTLSEIISAHAHSSRFTDLARGTTVTLPTGDTVKAQLESLERSERPEGLRFSKFSFICNLSKTIPWSAPAVFKPASFAVSARETASPPFDFTLSAHASPRS